MNNMLVFGRNGLLALLLIPGSALLTWAGPEKCTVTGTKVACRGDQSRGIRSGTDFPLTVTELVVDALSAAIAPVAGTPGILIAKPAGPSSVSITLNAIIKTLESEAGVTITQQGANGANGSNGALFLPRRPGGGAGGAAAGSVVLLGQGSIDNSVQNRPNTAAVFVHTVNGNGGTGGAASGWPGDGARGGNGYSGAQGKISIANQGTWRIVSEGKANAMGVYLSASGGQGGNGGTGSGVGSGGTGGTGGTAQDIVAQLASSGGIYVTTRGSTSHGFYLKQQAGNGGVGGARELAGAGGDGGHGGNGGNIAVNTGGSNLSSTTNGVGSIGLYVWNAAGNGGNGRDGGLIGNGGYAGNGGQGGNINLDSTAQGQITIATSQDKATGVLLLTEGGNGGDGGRNSSSGGKNGGWGGGGGAITADMYGTVITHGADAHAIAAQSLGGVGGRGGVGGIFGGGGNGGNTGPSGPVTLATSGFIQTSGAGSYGVLAQSVAGHAGNGGDGVGLVSFAASGGSAGAGGTVKVTNTASILTAGDQSMGVVAQSIGGGGGNGGRNFGLFYAGGGAGTAGGNGGNVTVANSGDLTLSGNDATGIAAQSIGGTGGMGGTAIGLIAFGGGGGEASHGGAVAVNNSGVIKTGFEKSGDTTTDPSIENRVCGKGCSEGIFAQSIGGGGGKAGSSVGWFSIGGAAGGGGNGGAVDVVNSNTISTALARSGAIEAASIGGGGGKGGAAISAGIGLSAAIGGSGGKGGDGGKVTVRNAQQGLLSTLGDSSPGLKAQSVGKGGGDGGFAVTVAAGVNIPAVAIAIGGASNSAGKGDAVSMDNAASISTQGNHSAGIHAQSQGGGGGTGGFAVAASLSDVGAVSLGIGGRGGSGGDGGLVTVKGQDGVGISTQGDNSSGVFAQSGGGGGGDGGLTIAAAAAQGGAAFSIGRSGGSGGNGADVMVTQGTGSIYTKGIRSLGIQAQSVGDSGGNGSLAISAAAGGKIGALSFAMGGSGAAGGKSGVVTVSNKAHITTEAAESSGVFAQSVGGGGGNGGMSIAGGLTSSLGKANIDIAIGGGGGNAGKAAAVNVSNEGNITATGDKSMGIAAQSVGKGGGSGGLSVAGAIGALGDDSFSIKFALGGNGGGGGDADTVTVKNTGNILTGGAGPGIPPEFNYKAPPCAAPPCVKQYGISAQSVGGGGGRGGMAGTLTLSALTPTQKGMDLDISTAVGGKGGAGGKSQKVSVENSGTVTTVAPESAAIFAQSVAGGGGDGGQAINYSIKPGQGDKVKSVTSVFTMGGVGGSGQVGGDVEVTNSGALTTLEYASHGIFAQSVGGGGGNGGDTGSFHFGISCVRGVVSCDGSANKEGNWSLTTKIGGAAGNGNHGGVVTVSNAADITTTGGGADAINAASIGGGGGNGGGDSGLTALPSSIPFLTGDRLTAFRAFSFSLGGSGGAQGDGRAVSVFQDGHTLHTEGAGAAGIYAQSVGGGGGTSRIYGNGGTVSATGTKPFSISVGGTGGAGGHGGAVKVEVVNGTRITTGGKAVYDSNGKLLENSGAYGIFAQSVGGGGGVGGSAKLQGIPGGSHIPDCDWCGKVSIGIGLPITGAGGIGGNGGVVTVSANGSIVTGSELFPGDSSPAILAQSVGGGGGIAGYTAINPLGVPNLPDVMRGTFMGSGNSGGSAGAVNIAYTGDIQTWGAASSGIMAQSAGSGKPAAVSSIPSNGSNVTIDFTGTLRAMGKDSAGIWAQSAGYDRNGDIKITIGPGSLVSGGLLGETFKGAGIELKDGTNNNVVDNYGTLTSRSGIALAHTGQGKVTLNNYGAVEGNVALGAASNRLNNHQGGVLRSDLIDLGGGELVNHGTLSPSGTGQLGVTQVEGSLLVSRSGVLYIDIDNSQAGNTTSLQSDVIHVKSDFEFAGTVHANVINDGRHDSGEQTVIIAQTSGNAVVSEGELVIDPSAVARFQIFQPSAQQLALRYDIDFANAGILAVTNDNQDRMAQHIENIYRADLLNDDVSAAFIAIQDTGAYADVMNTLSAEVAVDNQISSLLSSLRFNDELLGCAERAGDYRILDQGQCSWLRVAGQHFDQNEVSDNLGFDENSWQVAGGGQYDMDNGWFLGAALSYESRDLNADHSASSSEGSQYQIGVSAKRMHGNFEVSGSLAVGYGDFDLQRQPWMSDSVDAGQHLWLTSAQLRVAHPIASGRWTFTPRTDLGVDYLSMNGFNESGNSAFKLDYEDQSDAYYNLQPAIDIATDIETDSGVLVRPKLTLGITHFLGDAEPSVTGQFFYVSDDVAPFTTRTRLDRTRFDVAAGVEVFAGSGVVVRAEVFGSLSDDTESYGGGLRAEMPF